MRLMTGVFTSVVLLASAAANAATYTYDVDAFSNSIANGLAAGVGTVILSAGESFTVTASTDDLWSAGSLPRFSDANGLTGNRDATSSDDSGQPVGTQIGQSFAPYTTNGFTAYYGQLVGLIDDTYVALGTNYTGVATKSGQLKLFYWDENAGDNFGKISVSISVVPEPESAALFFAGLTVLGYLHRRYRS